MSVVNRTVVTSLITALLVLPTATSAASPSRANSCTFGSLEVGIPFGNGARAGDLICTFIDNNGGADNALDAIFRLLAIGLTVIVVMFGMTGIVWGGYIYMTAAGNASRIQNAKAWIGAALLGITLALLAYTILAKINPSFVG